MDLDTILRGRIEFEKHCGDIYAIRLSPTSTLAIDQRTGRWFVGRKVDALDKMISLQDCVEPENAVPKESYPKLFTLQLTGRCNLRCSYCYQRPNPVIHSATMTKDTLYRSIDMALGSGTDTIHVDFYGGEPLLAPERIYDAFQHPQAESINFGIQTNGTLLTEELADDLVRNKVVIGISLNGDEETHNTHRGKWHQTVRGIEVLKQAGANIGIGATFTRKTFTRASSSIDLFLDLSLTNISMSVVRPNCSALGSFLLGRHDYMQFYAGIFNDLVEHYQNDIYIYEREIGYMIRYLCTDIRTYMCKASPCGAGLLMLSVSPDGVIFPCARYGGIASFAMGNIADTDIYCLSRTEQIKELAALSTACRKCAFLNLCYGGCPAENRFAHNVYLPTHDWSDCVRARILLFIILRITSDPAAESYCYRVISESESL